MDNYLKESEQDLEILEKLKKRIKSENLYYLYISSRTTNSIFSITDVTGNVIFQRSCGKYFKGTNKATQVAHIDTSKQLASLMSFLEIKKIFMLFKGRTSWNSDVFQEFVTFEKNFEDTNKNNIKNKRFTFEISGFRNLTGIPFNGCRKWKYTLKNKKRKNRNKD